MSSLADDVRFGLRTFRRHPWSTVVVVGTLAIGIAAASVIFSIVNAALYAKFDVYRDPGRLVYVIEQNPQVGSTGGVSAATLADWRAGSSSFERLAGVKVGSAAVVGAGAEPESAMWAGVTDGLLAALDARPAAGRLFSAAEYAAPGAHVVLISHGFWTERYGGDESAIGRSVKVDGRWATIAGVLAPEFTLAPFLGASPSIFEPLASVPGADRTDRTLMVIGRLKQGVPAERARTELEATSASIAAADPAGKGWTPWLIQPRSFDMSGDAQFLIVLAVGVGLVLMIVCANVVNLLLAQSAGRAREVATRLALGAGRRRLARQFLTETLLLGVAGSTAGALLAWWACRGINWWIAGTGIGHLNLGIDARVTLFAVLVSTLMTLGVGVLPAARIARLPVADALKDATSLWGRLSAGRLRRMLAAGEVALALVLLVSAGLVLQGLINLRENDPGYRADNLLTLRLTLPDSRYGEPGGRAAFVEQALGRLASRPAFEAAAVTSLMPAIGGEAPVEAFELEGGHPDTGRPPSAGLLSVSPRYFETMGVALLRGRAFDGSDHGATVRTAVVSRGLVDRWMKDADPVGARIRVEGEWRTIVGVVGDVRTFHLNVAPRPTIYLPYSQRPVPSFWLAMRATGGDQAALVAAARADIRAIDGEQPVRGGEWAATLLEKSMGGFDMTGLIVGVLAFVAVALAALGIYGVVAFSVARRTRELGVRIALGAAPGQVVRQVVGEGLKMAAWGAVPGLLLALAAGRLLASKLQRVNALDPVLLSAVGLLVVVTILGASWGPARRAARVDPVAATRAE